MKSLILLPALAATPFLAIGTSAQQNDLAPGTDMGIVQTAIASGGFDTLVAALNAADLARTLNNEGPFTVFAPTNEAFAALPPGTVDFLLQPENIEALTTILTYHVVPGIVTEADVVTLDKAQALNGQRFDIQVDENGVMVAGVDVVDTDIMANNGVIHVVNGVMMPNILDIIGTAGRAGVFNTLAAALDAADLLEVLGGDGPFTVFAPTDAAFAKLPEGTVESLLLEENRQQLIDILKYHVVSGRAYSDQLAAGEVPTLLEGQSVTVSFDANQKPLIDGATVRRADVDTKNGVIHVIDRVLIP